MKILAIDTSCDDTSVAISENNKILSNVFWSKIKTHSKWGGVVPLEARRQHEEFLKPVIDTALSEANITLDDIDMFAVTYGPGLAIALEPGIEKAKELSITTGKPLIAVNHMIGHIYANLASDKSGSSYSSISDFEFPLLALTISGGHTDLYVMDDHFKFEQIGRTLDDAIGESFDKVGRMLGMGFPAGYKIEQSANEGNPHAYNFPRPMKGSGDLNWSYSGLKTAVLYQIHKIIGDYGSDQKEGELKMDDASSKLSSQQISDISASFQIAAIESLVFKIERAMQKYTPKMLVVGGGVITNTALRTTLERICDNFGIILSYPKPMWLCTDNASMIAVAASYMYEVSGEACFVLDFDKLDRVPNLAI